MTATSYPSRRAPTLRENAAGGRRCRNNAAAAASLTKSRRRIAMSPEVKRTRPGGHSPPGLVAEGLRDQNPGSGEHPAAGGGFRIRHSLVGKGIRLNRLPKPPVVFSCG